jgi:4-hydroxythreonine-4-phosphate dehydrogenase
MTTITHKPVVGITVGDINGIGPEVILKTFQDQRILSYITPVVFACKSLMNYYLKLLDIRDLHFNITRNLSQLNNKQLNIFWNWEGEPEINVGVSTPAAGKYALKSLQAGVKALKEKNIDFLVTAPINKKNIQSDEFKYPGHSQYLEEQFGVKNHLMLMVNEDLRVALQTEHIPVNQISAEITTERILSKLEIFKKSLEIDFCIRNPKIALLALNPHAGDDGLVGEEEITTIIPAMEAAKSKGMYVMGPFPADGFFADQLHLKYDGILAMYHDQGLIPFKSFAFGKGINFTAGLPVIRTSPAHGTAYGIAGKNEADETSFREAIFMALKIRSNRILFETATADPLKPKIEREKERDVEG